MQVSTEPVASTGIAGLDAILGGGFPKDHVYLIQGDPGAGKTTLALQFLLEGVKRGETVLYVTLSETRRELHGGGAVARLVARRHRRSSSSSPREETLAPKKQNTMFHPVRGRARRDRLGAMLAEVERVQAAARRDRLALRDAAAGAEPAALPPADPRAEAVLHRPRAAPCSSSTTALARATTCSCTASPHGVIVLEQLAPMYGARAAAAASHQAARRRVPRRLSRLHHPHAAASTSSRGWSPPSIAATFGDGHIAERHRRARRAARRRPRARHEHAAHGPGRRRASRRWPRSTPSPRPRAASASALFIFDESLRTLLDALRGAGHGPRASRSRPGRITRPAGRPRRARRPASSPTSSATPSRSTARASSSSTASTATSTPCPRSGSSRSAARAADLPRPAGRGDASWSWRSTA